MKMDFKIGGRPSFFKILPSDSLHYLPLPSAFAKKYLEENISKTQTLVLKPKSSVKWSVKYSNIEDRYYFMDGWLKFMKDNRLQKGDFLVFWLLSPSPNSTFQVSLYAPNGCLKRPTGSSGAGDDKDDQRRKKADFKKEASDDVSGENLQPSFSRVFAKSHTNHMPMTRGFVEATGINGYDSVVLKNDEGKSWTVELRWWRREQYPIMSTGWLCFRRGNKIKIGDTCEFIHVKSNMVRVRVLKKKSRRTSI